MHPISEYGRSKLGGELEVERHAATWATVRTAWVFGRRGTDLLSWAFGAYDRGELDGVLADQVSIPTYAPDLAVLLARFAVERRQGLFHATSGSEAVTRHELIVTALEARGVDPSGIAPIDAADLDRPAARPKMSALDNRALRLAGLPSLRPWRDAVTEYVKDWRHERGRASSAPGTSGLTTAACLAHLGHEVMCADIDEERVRALSKGEVPILEEGLPALVAEGLGVAAGCGSSSARPTPRRGAEFVFLCVQTPQGDDGAADLSLRRGRRPRDRAGAARRAPSSSTSRRCRSARPGSSQRVLAEAGAARATSASRRTPSSCARARRSTTSSTPTAS